MLFFKFRLGMTDEFGFGEVENEVHVPFLHLFGIDNVKLTYRHQGRDFVWLDVPGRLVHEIIA